VASFEATRIAQLLDAEAKEKSISVEGPPKESTAKRSKKDKGSKPPVDRAVMDKCEKALIARQEVKLASAPVSTSGSSASALVAAAPSRVIAAAVSSSLAASGAIPAVVIQAGVGVGAFVHVATVVSSASSTVVEAQNFPSPPPSAASPAHVPQSMAVDVPLRHSRPHNRPARYDE